MTHDTSWKTSVPGDSPPHGHGHGHHRPPAVRRPGVMLALICVAQFMLVLDVTVVNVALPDMAADLHLSRTALTWVVTAYTLCFGGLMLLGGRLADALGARRTLLAGLAVFTAASLVSGLAGSASMLIGGRIAQGVGAALLSPAALSLVTTSFHGPARNKALGVWAAIGGTGSAIGVLVGGALAGGPAGAGSSTSTCPSASPCWPPSPSSFRRAHPGRRPGSTFPGRCSSRPVPVR